MKKQPFKKFATGSLLVGLQIVDWMSKMYGQKAVENAQLIKTTTKTLHVHLNTKYGQANPYQLFSYNDKVWSWISQNHDKKESYHFDTVEQFLEWAYAPEKIQVVLNANYTAEIVQEGNRVRLRVNGHEFPTTNILKLAEEIKRLQKYEN